MSNLYSPVVHPLQWIELPPTLVYYFYDTGKIKEKISYHNGTPVGEYKVFSEKGTVIEKGKYEEGVRINK